MREKVRECEVVGGWKGACWCVRQGEYGHGYEVLRGDGELESVRMWEREGE